MFCIKLTESFGHYFMNIKVQECCSGQLQTLTSCITVSTFSHITTTMKTVNCKSKQSVESKSN